MPDPFDEIEAKIDRAGEHIDALNGEIRHWAEGNPYSIEAEPKGQSTHHRIYVRLHEVPDVRRWGLLLGDAVHNMRSALDHLVYALAIRVTGQDPPPGFDRLQFVIVDDPSDWKGQMWHLKPLSDEMRALIESVQPYKTTPLDRVQYDLLRWLRELDDADKHRVIRPVFIAPAGFEAILRTITEGPMTIHAPLALIEDEATIFTVAGEAITEVEDEIKVALGIGIEVVPKAPLLLHVALDQMFNRVVDVARQFREGFLS
jgi:hypothetical protein